MLSLTTGHDPAYMYKQVATGKENYYTKATDQGEAPGIWQGKGAEDLGLTGQVDPQDMKALYQHFVDPRDPRFRSPDQWEEADKLGRAPRKFAAPDEVLVKKLAKEGNVTGDVLKGLRKQAGDTQTLIEMLSKGVLPERVEQLRLQAQKEARSAVPYFDATFSPQKSISILHASLRAREVAAAKAGNVDEARMWAAKVERVEAAVWAGNNAALNYLYQHAGYSRAGYHGKDVSGRFIDAHKWTVASFFQTTSRADDMQLHIHNAILNRVECSDGKWRTLHGSAIYRVRPAAAAIGERVMEQQLINDPLLRVEMRMRPDGVAREVVGVSEEARDLFSARTRATTKAVKQLVAAFHERYGHAPNALQLARLTKKASLATRPRKSDVFESPAARVERWNAELRAEVDQMLTDVPQATLGRTPDPAGAAQTFDPDLVIQQALEDVQGTKAAWTRFDLIRALNDKLPDCLGELGGEQVERLLHELADTALMPRRETAGTHHEVVLLTAPDLVEVPQELRLANGRSAYEDPSADVYAVRGHLLAEEAIVAAARAGKVAPAMSAERVNEAINQLAEAGTELGADQRAAVTGVLTSGKPLEVLIGPAGTGKSFTIGMISDLWQSPSMWQSETAPRVFGLATSQRAVDVLAEEGIGHLSNVRNWLEAQGRLERGSVSADDRQLALRAGDLLILDEAGMTATAEIEDVRQRCERAGVKVLLAGDDRQLTAVGAGGGLRLASEDDNTYRLEEVRRFEQEWERRASLRLRDADPQAVAIYERHGRVVDAGTVEQASQEAARGWLADTLAGKRSVLVVDTNDQAADLSARLRAELVALGMVEETGVQLRDPGTFAGVGDVIQARRNDWSVRRLFGRAVVNRELYKVVDRGQDGSLAVRRILESKGGSGEKYGPQITLKADYVATHVTLGYAVTVHSVQGSTVKTTHSVVTDRTRGDAIYVALSRGTESNTAYLATVKVAEGAPRVPEDIKAKQPGEERVPAAQMMAGILERHEPDRAATEVREASLLASMSLETLMPRWTEAVQRVSGDRYAEVVDRLAGEGVLTGQQARELVADEAAGPLWRMVRNTELAGRDPYEVLRQAIEQRELHGLDSLAKGLWARIHDRHGRIAPQAETFSARTPADSSDWGRYAAGLADAMDTRIGMLGEKVAETAPEWAVRRLGPVPDELIARAEWTRNAGLVAAYREAYGRGDDRDAIGPCPRIGQPEARAAWHAAHRALGQPKEIRDEATLSEADLRGRIAAWDRAQSWAPPWVGQELQETSHAARSYHQEAQFLKAQAANESDTRVKADLLQTSEGYAAVAAELNKQVERLTFVDDARATWYLHTTDVRVAAEAAMAELTLRGADLDAQPGYTAEEVLAGEHKNPPVAAAEVDDEVDSDAAVAGTKMDLTATIHLDESVAEDLSEAHVAVEGVDTPATATWTAQWPAGVPTLDETVDAAKKASNALRTIEERTAALEAERLAAEAAELEAREADMRDDAREELELADEGPSLAM